MKIKRRKTRSIKLGNVSIGGKSVISLQSMLKIDTNRIQACLRQIKELKNAGCEIVRIAVRNTAACRSLSKISQKSVLPIEADIHFNYRCAIEAINAGVDGIRLNPGNINKKTEIEKIVKVAKKKNIPIRVGINSGSLPQRYKTQERGHKFHISGANLTDVMVTGALDYIKLLEKLDFYDIMVSLKASNVLDTVYAYKKMARLTNIPFHLGVTATGYGVDAVIKSSIGIGSLLMQGIGDTIRVSLTAPAVEEIYVGKKILSSLGLRNFGPEVISCPTCGRCRVNLQSIVKKVRDKLQTAAHKLQVAGVKHRKQACLSPTIQVAIMGCEVNGPGEAKEADIGVACGNRRAVLFKKGKVIKKIKEKDIAKELVILCAGQKH